MNDNRPMGDDGAAARFVDEVTAQVRRAVGEGDEARRARDAAAQLVFTAAGAEAPRCDPVEMLSTFPALLAAVFQNVDLLYEARDPRAEAIGRWVMDAIARITLSEG